MATIGTINEEGVNVDLYIPRKCHASNTLIPAFDFASIQINIGDIDANGVYAGTSKTLCIAGFLRNEAESDHAINRLCITHGVIRARTGKAKKQKKRLPVRAPVKKAVPARGPRPTGARAPAGARGPRPAGGADRKPRVEGERRGPRPEGDRKPRNEGERRHAVTGERSKAHQEGERRGPRPEGDKKPREGEHKVHRAEGERKPVQKEGLAAGERRGPTTGIARNAGAHPVRQQAPRPQAPRQQAPRQ